MEIDVLLHNIRSVYNVGAILRTCDGLGIHQAIFSGYTPRYDDPELLPHLRTKLNHQIEKAALGAEKSVKQLILDEKAQKLLTNSRKCAIMEGYAYVIGLENNLSSEEAPRRLILGQNTLASGEKVHLDGEILLILGEEVHGIPAELRAKVDYFLEIPMHGQKESFNVSVATGIALWGLQNCYTK